VGHYADDLSTVAILDRPVDDRACLNELSPAVSCTTRALPYLKNEMGKAQVSPEPWLARLTRARRASSYPLFKLAPSSSTRSAETRVPDTWATSLDKVV
jgi:hypothetical protein